MADNVFSPAHAVLNRMQELHEWFYALDISYTAEDVRMIIRLDSDPVTLSEVLYEIADLIVDTERTAHDVVEALADRPGAYSIPVLMYLVLSVTSQRTLIHHMFKNGS